MPPNESEFIPVTGRDWLGVPAPGPGPGPGPESPDDEILDTLDAIQAQMAQNQCQLVALENFNTERVLQRIDDVKSQMEESLKKVLVLYLAANRPGGGEPTDPVLPRDTGTSR